MVLDRWRSAKLGRFLAWAVITAVMLPAISHAEIVGNPASETSGDTEFVAAERLIEAQQFAEALSILQRVVGRDPGNADAYNYLAFSQRKVGLLDEAMRNYKRALDLDPDHIGAREYLGELYLQLGQQDKAEEQLAILMRLCPLGCEPREDLAQAIAAIKSAQSP